MGTRSRREKPRNPLDTLCLPRPQIRPLGILNLALFLGRPIHIPCQNRFSNIKPQSSRFVFVLIRFRGDDFRVENGEVGVEPDLRSGFFRGRGEGDLAGPFAADSVQDFAGGDSFDFALEGVVSSREEALKCGRGD